MSAVGSKHYLLHSSMASISVEAGDHGVADATCADNQGHRPSGMKQEQLKEVGNVSHRNFLIVSWLGVMDTSTAPCDMSRHSFSMTCCMSDKPLPLMSAT